MHRFLVADGFAFLVLLCAVGCSPEAPDTAVKQDESGHVHDPGDAMTWKRKEKIQDSEYETWFGHPGDHFHIGESFEPANAITQGEQAISDAQVFNRLVDSQNATEMITEESSTVHEPETDEEIAHYAQGELVLPKDVSECLIRFRVVLPGQADEITRDVSVKIGHWGRGSALSLLVH